MVVSKLIVLILFLLPPLSAQQNITLSSSLVANNNSPSWTSPSGDFAFGFHKLVNTNLFLLAIWFDKIPDKTIVWDANGDKPAQQGSKLEVSVNGLLLTDPGGQLIWEQQTATVSYAAMLDTGNFVLVDNNSDYLWESFKNPTDTILPSQALEPGTFLFSRLAETNYSRGRFQLYFLNGDLQLSPVGWPTKVQYGAYFSSGTSSSDSSVSGYQLVFNQSDIYMVKTDGVTVRLPWQQQDTAPSLAGNYYRATLDYNGVLTQYVCPKGSGSDRSWSIVQYIPQDICSAIFNGIGSGACGYNSICTEVNGRPNCACPLGYSFIDQNNLFGGCKPDFPLGCGVADASENMEDLYEFRELQYVNWPLGDYERLSPYSVEECKTSCLQDCMCAAAIYGSSICWKKRIPLANGRLEKGNSLALIKVRKGAPLAQPGLTCIKKKKQDKTILFGSLGTSLVLNAFFLFTVPLILFLKLNRKSNKVLQLSTLLETNLHMFSYKELEEATDNFKEQVGRGSSAIVYKGILKCSPNNVIAVKKLDKLSQEAEKEFRTEMKVIGKTCHKNLVRLLGFCEEGSHRLLVYQFMTRGTLANFLLGIPKPEWNIRAQIVLEIARGLLYLHEECEAPIIHCDIKPENILLDEYFTAKISDFGLSKLLLSNQSRTMTLIRGTRGYVAPEWFRNVAVTAKVDVYSFGVVLLEIICCKKNVSKLEDEKDGILTEWVYDCLQEERLDAVIEFDEEAVADKERLNSWVRMAIWCTQEDPSTRPSMKTVLQMLEGFTEIPSLPKYSFSSNF
ncbi:BRASSINOSTEROID INSENSITIVE 1-associated receptor kinase 1 precursor, putative [Ricinus communis]|uniref:Receptor-like serine/threonine-protein kinase n=1 Tax=Ricinus communis TaxID=3988 RepID=B9T289_RICCO|nr:BRASSINOSTEROID INSENSITIVE 1-associated receptor kinase 1 precursor, putative [Ricinus communis]|eukprot:XP_002532358.1 G-type lectin S-receptor-like serine/threonine-protein kinase LECRK3 [Ricinus communis]